MSGRKLLEFEEHQLRRAALVRICLTSELAGPEGETEANIKPEAARQSNRQILDAVDISFQESNGWGIKVFECVCCAVLPRGVERYFHEQDDPVTGGKEIALVSNSLMAHARLK